MLGTTSPRLTSIMNNDFFHSSNIYLIIPCNLLTAKVNKKVSKNNNKMFSNLIFRY